MSLLDLNLRPADRQLRQFAWISLFALPLIGWFWGGSIPLIAILAVVGAAMVLVSLVWPQALKPIFLGLTLIALPIGFVVSELSLLLIYFVFFLPLGLLFRLMKRDALQLKFDRRASTYWQPKPRPRGPSSYFRPF
jgi:hypothetical protein